MAEEQKKVDFKNKHKSLSEENLKNDIIIDDMIELEEDSGERDLTDEEIDELLDNMIETIGKGKYDLEHTSKMLAVIAKLVYNLRKDVKDLQIGRADIPNGNNYFI